jgi:hypothetical protein
VIAGVTLVFQLLDPVFAAGVFWVGVWFVLGVIWFALVGRNRLVLAPEEAFAMEKAGGKLLCWGRATPVARSSLKQPKTRHWSGAPPA